MSWDVPWWHVAWSTFRSWPPTDRRADGSALAQLYAELAADGELPSLSSPLPDRWLVHPQPPDSLKLDAEARDIVRASILGLTEDDRLAGDTPVGALKVLEHGVQVLLACPEAVLHQRVGRLKSRSATELAFASHLGVGGRGTWSRGFWWARLSTDAQVHGVRGFILSS